MGLSSSFGTLLVPLVDGFEDVTDLLCGSDLKKASPKDSWTPFALGQGAGQLGTEGPYSLHLYSPFVVIYC